MEVSGQLHAPDALLPGKEPPITTGQEAGCAPEPVWTWWRGNMKTEYIFKLKQLVLSMRREESV
jgi:hypothetical protein